MTKRMLIDATHAEETRVVVLDGARLEDFDVETSAKKQLKGNIYLAKVVRVEPSLQAAFVEYGGGRHGFLAFGEIHPDYYQIPVADRQRLLAMQAEEARAEAEAEEREVEGASRPPRHQAAPRQAPEASAERPAEAGDTHVGAVEPPAPDESEPLDGESGADESETRDGRAQPAMMARDERFGPADADVAETPIESLDIDPSETTLEDPPQQVEAERAPDITPEDDHFSDLDAPSEAAPPPETIGGDSESSGSDDARRRRESRFLRNYRIQEVIRRRQIMLIQVVKEERGTKGAALTTYISLAGRFSVLMPNSPRGGGISRKITSASDRRRLKEVTAELDLPQGMGLIVRTAGANRPKPEIRRDCEYLMRLWDDIREHTLRSIAPALIYEEASLIKRAIRDVYSRDIDEIVVDGEAGWKAAHEFMRMLMPSHANKVQLWRGEGGQPLFAKHQVEAQLDAMLSPTVQLKSGGYLVINQTEALVAIDVNSGRSTRERNVEETAFRTNLEAADEAARQLRLRDLAGLIVIDFIDMEVRRNNAAVERRLKDALTVDRARIQVGSISHFGLLEMSRQRLRPSVTESSFVTCPHCGGSGHVRGTETSAIHILRAIEDEGARGRAAVIMVHAASSVVMFLLNHKRDRLGEIEARTGMRVQFAMDESMVPPAHRIEKIRARTAEDPLPAPLPVAPVAPAFEAPDEAPDVFEDEPKAAESPKAPAPTATETAEEGEHRRRRRRRRRGGRRDAPEGSIEGSAEAAAGSDSAETFSEVGSEDDEAAEPAVTVDDTAEMPVTAELVVAPEEETAPVADEAMPAEVAPMDAAPMDAAPVEAAPVEAAPTEAEPVEAAAPDGEATAARRRGRRGGRRRRKEDGTEPATGGEPEAAAEAVEAPKIASYTGPTPADPFGGTGFDIYDLLDTAPPEPKPPRRAPAKAREPVAPKAPEPELAPEPLSEPAHVEQVVETEAAAAIPEPDMTADGPEATEQPTIIAETTPQGEPKRGWWRR